MTNRLAGVVLLGGTLLLLGGCQNRNRQAAQAAADAAAGGISGSPAQYFSVPANQMSHIQVVRVDKVNWPDVLRLPGTVDYDQFETTPVLAQVGGKVAQILVIPGQQVRQGQPLLDIASPDFAQARNAYVKAKDAYDLADRILKRTQDLLAHGAETQADVEQAQSTRDQAQADLEAAEQSLRILGLPDPDSAAQATPMAEIPLTAPITGQVVERDVAPGQLLQAGATQCFVLSDMSKVWVLVNIYQSDLANVHVGDAVEIDTSVYPKTFSGRIQFISPAMDANTHTLQARIETDNPDGELKKDMYVTATVRAGDIRGALLVPDAAVLRDDQNNPFVYVARGQNQFEQRAVTLGQAHGGQTQIVSGLNPGESVAGDGSLFLQFARSLQ